MDTDQTIKIWNSFDGTWKRTLNGHTILVIPVLNNGNLASCYTDQTIKNWSTKSN